MVELSERIGQGLEQGRMSALSTAEGLLSNMRDACNKGNSADAAKILSQLKVCSIPVGVSFFCSQIIVMEELRSECK